MSDVVGRVSEVWHYPVKSLQGVSVDALSCSGAGFELDREWAVVATATGRVLSAKTVPELLLADVETVADGPTTIVLPDRTRVECGDEGADEVLSDWLDRPVELKRRNEHHGGGYDMTFDPPDDAAEQYEIPIIAGSFFDLTNLHLLTTGTLEAARAEAPELDWDVRRFRPNLMIENDGEAFAEDAWCGGAFAIGEVPITVQQPTVRCAMPLRAQPGLARSVEIYRALQSVHANHLGVYGVITGSGTIRCGDPVTRA